MKNTQIVKILSDMATLMTLKGEDRFRIIAFERGARALEILDKNVDDIYQEGGLEALDEIEDIGEGIARRIAELIETGKLKEYEKLKKSFPAITLQLLDVPGIGPKTAIKLVDKLRIEKLQDLPKLLISAQGQKIFSKKIRENILKGWQFLSTQEHRMLLHIAEPIADEVIEAMKESSSMTTAEAVGSLRRQKETIGDIDLVAASEKPKEALRFVLNQPFVKRVVNQGDTKATFIHQGDCQIDVEMLPPKNYGSLLQHFTGSKEHNIHLRTYAESKNMSISEYGIKKGGKLIACAKEEEVYRHLGMPWIPPELREDRGEIEAALKNILPNLIELKDVKGDLHIHSNWSDGHNTIYDMAQAAKELGYEYIVVADHTAGLGVARGLNERDINERQKEIEAVNEKITDFKVLAGLEVNIRADSSLDISNAVLAKMDIVTASLHSALNQDKDIITKRLMAAMENPHVDIIGHPSGRLIEERSGAELEWEKIFKTAVATQTALEINASPHRLDLKDTLVQRAKEVGVKIAICTDAHTPMQMMYLRYGVAVARRGWLEKKDVLNTLPATVLLKQMSEKSS